MTITEDELARLDALAQAATPGPWFIAYSAVHAEPLTDEYHRIEKTIPVDAPDEAYGALPDTAVAFVPVAGGDTPTIQGGKDGAFIAAARDAVPALVAEVRQLRVQRSAWHATADALRAENERLRAELAEEKRHLLADEERRKLTGDAIAAESENERLHRRILELEMDTHPVDAALDREGMLPAATTDQQDVDCCADWAVPQDDGRELRHLRIEAAELRASLADAVGKIAAMEPVVEAAMSWLVTRIATPLGAAADLASAVRAYEAAHGDVGSSGGKTGG
jgi:hypothetical protein